MGNKAQSAYAGIVVTPRMLEAVLVKNTEGKWFRFDLWQDRVFIMNRREEWMNWQDFDSGYHDSPEEMEELSSLYYRWYGQHPPKNAVKVTLTKAIWAKMYLSAADRTGLYSNNPTKNPVTGERERKRSLDRRGYRALDVQSVEHLQNQALIVHRELLKLHTQLGKEVITEAEVSDMMTRLRDSGILKTKQDPFRIFQYYRPALIKSGKLEFLE